MHTTIEQIDALIEARTAELHELRRRREASQATTDVSMRRELRKLVDDAEADINELLKEKEAIEAWADSPARREQLAFARSNRDQVLQKYDDNAKGLWLEFNSSLLASKAIAQRLAAEHSEIEALSRAAILAEHPRDDRARTTHITYLTGIAGGASPELGEAVAMVLGDVLQALPGTANIPMELVAPSGRTPAPENAIERAFAKSKERLVVRLQDAIKEQAN